MEEDDFGEKIYKEIEQFMEKEIANFAGSIVSLRTYTGDCISGVLNCVKNGAAYITDLNGNKCYCSIEMISFYTAHPKKKGKKKNANK